MTDIEEEGDAGLALRAAAGDDLAFGALMRRHKTGLYSFVRRYVGERDAALDVVQEAFVAAWKAIGRYDPQRPFGVWLRAIALNKCRDRGRRAAVRRLVFGEKDIESAEAQAQADTGPTAEAALQTMQRLDVLGRAIARLPEKLKAPLILTQLEGLSQQEVAAQLGVSVKTVETRVYRAKQRLSDDLARSGLDV